MVREIRGVLSLAPQRGWRVPIVKTEAVRGEGVEALVEQLEAHRAFIVEEGTLSERRRRNLRNEVLGLCTFRLRRRLEERLAEDDEFTALLDEVVERHLDPPARRARSWSASTPARRRRLRGDHRRARDRLRRGPGAARAFFAEALGLRAVDAGGGWLIFALPPAELACHPTRPTTAGATSST
jgi:hypothetical protein